MAKLTHRAFAGFFAGLFLLTSSALTIAVVYQAVQDNKKTQNQAKTSTKTNQTAQEAKLDNFTPTTQPQAQLQSTDIKVGDGQEVKSGDTITADYTGAVMSTGQVFDASSKHGGPATFSLSQVIAGWSQGVPGMKVGGTRRLLIPASLAYGPNPPQGSGIPANADLVFDITVTKIGQ
jgi:FKBP-type peptidyl-prolyl cis-trans isomerase